MGKRILIDPGHGGKDPGAVNGKRQEKNDVLKGAFKIGAFLKSAGHSVSYTRTSDKTLSLGSRSSMDRRGNYDFFISFHRDSFSKSSANGVSVFIYTNTSTSSTAGKVARKVVDGVVKVTGFTNRGVRKANFHVLRETKSPAILIECGFISNNSDNLKFDKYFDKICYAIAEGVCNILGGSISGKAPEASKPTTSQPTTKALYRVKVNGVQVGAYSSLTNAKAMADSRKGIVYDMNGKQVYPTAKPTTKALYRVKVNGVQIGAYSSLTNAKTIANSKKGIVYDMNGKQVYSSISTGAKTDEKYRYSENGTFYPNTKIYFRNAPSTDSSNPIQGSYSNGESVRYDIVVIGERYTWISWISGSTGKRRYMPIRDRKSGKPMWGRAV